MPRARRHDDTDDLDETQAPDTPEAPPDPPPADTVATNPVVEDEPHVLEEVATTPPVVEQPSPQPSAHALPEVPNPALAGPSLDQAFTTLCQAMSPHLEADMPAWQHCQEIQAWYANDVAGSQNHRQAWAHAVQLLEQVLGYEVVPR